MPPTETPTWWADVQQDRDDLGGDGRRPADDWLDEEIEFVPRHRFARRTEPESLHGVFVPAAASSGAATAVVERLADVDFSALAASDGPTVLELEVPLDPVEPEAAAEPALIDDPYAVQPPEPGQRRTVQIKGRPEGARVPSTARRHRPRTASDVVGQRPDRIVLWAVALGAILILLAAMTSSSQAAEIAAIALGG